MIAPVPEVGAPREPDVRRVPRRRRDGTVDHRPAPVELAREERRVLVLGGISTPRRSYDPEVAGGREADERAAVGVPGVDDQVLVAAHGDAGILDAEALGLRVERRQHAPLRVDHPVGEAVGAPRRAEVGEARSVLDANQEHGLVAHATDPGIEDRVDGRGPAGCREDRVSLVPQQIAASDSSRGMLRQPINEYTLSSVRTRPHRRTARPDETVSMPTTPRQH